MPNPLLSIIVLNWNGETIFPACLESLEKIEYPAYEVIFFDNGSTDNSVRLARDFQGIKIIENKANLGYAAGNNRAFQSICNSSKYVCFLNNDIVVTPAWLNDPIFYMEEHNAIGAIACRNMNYPNRKIIDGLYHYIRPFFALARFGRGLPYILDPLYSEPGFVMSALGASAIYRTDLFLSLGGFDESFYSYYEDADLCMRINNNGFRCLYVPNAIVYHHDQASFRKKANAAFYYSFRNELIFFKKNFPPLFLSRYLKKMLLENLRILKSCIFGSNDLRTFLRARKDSLAMLKNYHFIDTCRAFDAPYINQLILEKKVLFRNSLQ